ncbi:prolipoprotein diacylglyceryl transferase [Candidatus Pelagibacter sp.]|uniref:prolipoprotein diacylglyceryl transferase n=1 Tax=Candidatus Pelagibacter sp. TaxID=2024849 RepID=UPI003F84D218
MFINNFDPVAFSLFSLEFRWYSISYILGILAGWFLAKKIFIKDDNLKEKFDDYITFVILGIIIGGRLGYVIFYNFDYYLVNPVEIFKIWNGGMSFHGGLLGVIVMSIWFARKHSHNSYIYLDVVSLVAPIGIFFGRIANFINSELYGKETALPWGVKFEKIDELYRHPSQLYEAFFEGLLLFFILIYFHKRSSAKNPGFISGIFLIFYSTFRFLIEFLRIPDEQLGYVLFSFSMGQILCLVFFIFGSYLTLKKYDHQK